MLNLKTKIKHLINRAGLDIHLISPKFNPIFQIMKILNRFEVDLVFDIGANTGQFASELRFFGYKADIVSFEPLSKAHNDLLRASYGDSKWEIYSRCALGDHNGNAEINIAGNSESSSLLPMLASHSSAAPGTAYVGKESVPLLTLDFIAPKYLAKFKNPFLKIDTQGYEWQVLDGAMNVLPHMRGVLLELSLIPLYEGQHLWRELIDRLESEGFTLWALQQVFTDPLDGRMLQADGIFCRL